MCLKKNTRLSQSHTHIPSSTSSSLLQACIQLCSWQGGRPQLVRVGDWWMSGGHLCGSGSWLDGQPQLCTSGPWLLLSSSQKGSSEFVKSDFNFIIYVDKALWHSVSVQLTDAKPITFRYMDYAYAFTSWDLSMSLSFNKRGLIGLTMLCWCA